MDHCPARGGTGNLSHGQPMTSACKPGGGGIFQEKEVMMQWNRGRRWDANRMLYAAASCSPLFSSGLLKREKETNKTLKFCLRFLRKQIKSQTWATCRRGGGVTHPPHRLTFSVTYSLHRGESNKTLRQWVRLLLPLLLLLLVLLLLFVVT